MSTYEQILNTFENNIEIYWIFNQ